MKNLGSGENGEFTFLDIVSIISFCIGLQNLDINLTQDDIARATAQLDDSVNDKLTSLLNEIHNHLTLQDKKIDLIIKRLEDIKSDEDKKSS